MSSTGRSSICSAGVPSVHSYLFAFHVKGIILDSTLQEDAVSDAVKLEWILSDSISERYQSHLSGRDKPSPGYFYTSPPMQMINNKAEHVDTAFALLQCSNMKSANMSIMGGGMRLRLLGGGEADICIAHVYFDFSDLEVAAMLNAKVLQLRNLSDIVIGKIELCYVSQQRWIKVNKRKLAFLGDQRASNVKSCVETSANYVNSALSGNKEPTPAARNIVALNKFTPREDDFVLLFWNSTNSCFVKRHCDDYQLQLMHSFATAPFLGHETSRSCMISEAHLAGKDIGIEDNRSLAATSEGGTIASILATNSRVLQLPNILQSRGEGSSISPTSEMVSDFTEGDYTMTSGFSSHRPPESARLYDYLSQQNEQIQSEMAKQLMANTPPGGSCRCTPKGAELYPPIPRTSPGVTSPLAFNILDSCDAITDPSCMDLDSSVTSLDSSLLDSELGSDTDEWCSTNLSVDRLTRSHATSQAYSLSRKTNRESIDARRISTSAAQQACQVPNIGATGASHYAANARKIDMDGFEIPSIIPRFHKDEKVLIHKNQSVSTFDGGSTCVPNLSRSFNSLDLEASGSSYKVQDVIREKGDAPKPTDGHTNVDSILDTMSHFDIVEDMFCSVTVEDGGCSPDTGRAINIDRFYTDQYDYGTHNLVPGHSGSAKMNPGYMDGLHDHHDSELVKAAVASASAVNSQQDLYSAIYSAIIADINSCSLSDIGIDHAECSLDVMSEALNDAKAMQCQQDRLSNELLLNFFLQLLNCYSQKGVPHVMYMWRIVQKHLSAADLMKFLPEDYNVTVIRAALDILVQQLRMQLPSGDGDLDYSGTDYMTQHRYNGTNTTIVRGGTIINDLTDNQSMEFFRPLSECETYSESSDADECFFPTDEVALSQMRTQQFKTIMHRMYQQVGEMDSRKLVYISRLRSRPMKKRGCSLTLLAMKLALYRVFCGRRKLAPRPRTVVV